MRDSLRVLAISGALAVAAAVSPVSARIEGGAQTESLVKAADPAPAESPASPSRSLAPPVSAAPPVVVPEEDLKKAAAEIRGSWHDYDKCTHSKVCSSYFESFGVGITFGDGEIVPFSHVQRNTASRHDCIVNAREALDRGDRGMAVQWVMASHMLVPLDRNWLGDHPDAVLEALHQILF